MAPPELLIFYIQVKKKIGKKHKGQIAIPGFKDLLVLLNQLLRLFLSFWFFLFFSLRVGCF